MATVHLEPGTHDATPSNAAGVAPLRALLATVRRRARGWIGVEALAWAGIVAVVAFWLTLAGDWFSEPPAPVRAAAMAVAVAVLAGLLVRQLLLRLAAPLSDAALAHLVERACPEFRDSLSTAIDLADGDRDDLDAGLLARTTAEANRLAPHVRIDSLFRGRRLALLATAAAAAVASVGGLALARPDVVGLWGQRMIRLGDEPWPRRVALEAEGFRDGVRTVARGADVDVLVHAAAVGGPPDLVELRSRTGGGWRTERMGTRGTPVVLETGASSEAGATPGTAAVAEPNHSGPVRQTFGHMLTAVTDDTELEIRGGDARLQGLRLRVVEPPALADIEIAYDLPDYLGGGRRRAAAARVLRVPRGARLHVAGMATKPLAEATIVLRAGEDEQVVGGLREQFSGGLREHFLGGLREHFLGGLREAAGREISAEVAAVEGDAALVIQLTDTDGIASREPIVFVLSVIPDEPPRVALRPRGLSTAITPRGIVPLVGTVSDDHGLAAVAVEIQPTAGRAANRDTPRDVTPDASSGPAAPVVLPLVRAAPAGGVGPAVVSGGETLVELPDAEPALIPLQPLGLQVGSRIDLVVEARDGCRLAGGPNVGRSDTWTLEVVTPESLRALLEAREVLLRRRFESVIVDLTAARDRLREPDSAADAIPVASQRCGEAAARAAGETAEIAAAFRSIRDELDNNGLASPEVEERLLAEIATPLDGLAATSLPDLARASGTARDGPDREALARSADDALVRMRAILERMIELESFNEVLDRLRSVIRLQEEIRTETLQEHKKRARAALEGT